MKYKHSSGSLKKKNIHKKEIFLKKLSINKKKKKYLLNQNITNLINKDV